MSQHVLTQLVGKRIALHECEGSPAGAVEASVSAQLEEHAKLGHQERSLRSGGEGRRRSRSAFTELPGERCIGASLRSTLNAGGAAEEGVREEQGRGALPSHHNGYRDSLNTLGLYAILKMYPLCRRAWSRLADSSRRVRPS